MSSGQVLTFVMAGGEGKRLGDLCKDRTKPAVPFAGSNRLVDFPVCNSINSGYRKIYVAIEYMLQSLKRHIENGYQLSAAKTGDFVETIPSQLRTGKLKYEGTADSVRQCMYQIEDHPDCDAILVLAGDQIYKMDYRRMVDFHKENGSNLTISAKRVPAGVARGNLGVLSVDEDFRVYRFKEKPEDPETVPGDDDIALASMGIYVFDKRLLTDLLDEYPKAIDFGKEIIPLAIKDAGVGIFAYDYENRNVIEGDKVETRRYWKDAGTMDELWEANMDTLGKDPKFSPSNDKWPFRINYDFPFPQYGCITGSKIENINTVPGLRIYDSDVSRVVFSPGASVYGASVKKSVIFNDAVVNEGSMVANTIMDKKSSIDPGVKVGFDDALDTKRGVLTKYKDSNGNMVQNKTRLIPKRMRLTKDGLVPNS